MLKLILITIFCCSSAFAKFQNFLPAKIQFESHYIYAPLMSEADYLESIERFIEFAAPKFSVPFTIDSEWEVDWINALAYNTEDGAYIAVFGGMGRAPYMDVDAFNLILCHELGHHLGGLPQKKSSVWASAEGQSDYYATKTCLKQLWKDDQNPKQESSSEIKNICQKNFEDSFEQNICIRSLVAALNVTTMIAEVSEDAVPQISTPDMLEVEETELDYASLQCRLDTFVAGTLNRPRPKCWFAEGKQ